MVEYFYEIEPMEDYHAPEVRAVGLYIVLYKKTTKPRRFFRDKVRIKRHGRETIYRDYANNETIPDFIVRAHHKGKGLVKGRTNPEEDVLESEYLQLKKELKEKQYSFVDDLVGDDK